jgi:hypothetical protein
MPPTKRTVANFASDLLPIFSYRNVQMIAQKTVQDDFSQMYIITLQ